MIQACVSSIIMSGRWRSRWRTCAGFINADYYVGSRHQGGEAIDIPCRHGRLHLHDPLSSRKLSSILRSRRGQIDQECVHDFNNQDRTTTNSKQRFVATTLLLLLLLLLLVYYFNYYLVLWLYDKCKFWRGETQQDFTQVVSTYMYSNQTHRVDHPNISLKLRYIALSGQVEIATRRH